MKFDYTYIAIGGYPVFEPGVILTNTIIFVLGLVYCIRLRSASGHNYTRYMSMFLFFLGASTLAGAAGHGIHYQLGEAVFNAIIFFMNLFSMFSMYYAFAGSFILSHHQARLPRWIYFTLLPLLCLALGLSVWVKTFVVIKVMAGLAILYILYAHHHHWKEGLASGSRLVVYGFLISVVSIVVHTLRLSIHEWFNHKDLSHVVMIVAMPVIYRGIKLNSGASAAAPS